MQINAELTGKGAIRAPTDIPKGTEICIAYVTEFWQNSGDIRSNKQEKRTVQSTTPPKSTGDAILGIIAYSIGRTKTGMWVLFVEELIGTKHSRGKGLRIGRKLMKRATDEALSHGGVEEIHLVVRNASQQVHAHDMYRELGITRQKKNATKNRVRMGKLAREEQHWVGKIEAAIGSLETDPEGKHRAMRYNGLEETTAKARADIRSAFDEIHMHRNGDKAPWIEHNSKAIHVVIWETKWGQQTEGPAQQVADTSSADTPEVWNPAPGKGPSEEGRPQTPSTDTGDGNERRRS